MRALTPENVVEALLRTWKAALLVGLIAAGLILSGILFVNWGFPATRTYSTIVYLQFNSAAGDTYPDGSAFSVGDIAAQRVLAQAYPKTGLADYGIDYEDFRNGVSVRSYFATEEQLRDRYRIQFQRRDLSFAERQRLEEELAGVLKSRSQNSALLSLTIRRTFPVPAEMARDALRIVAETWAEDATSNLGRFRLSGASGTPTIIDPAGVERGDLALIYLVLDDAARAVNARLGELAALSNSKALVGEDGETTVAGLERRAQDVRAYRLAPIRAAIGEFAPVADPEYTKLVLRDRLSDIQRRRQTLQEQSGVLGQSFDSYRVALVESRRGEAKGTDMPAASQAPTQLTEGFVDRIISLSGAGAAADYLREISNRREDIEFRIAALKSDEREVGALISALDSGGRQEMSSALRQRIEGEAVVAARELNDIWQKTRGLFERAQATMTGFSGDKFILALPQDDVTTTRLVSTTVMLIAAALACFVFLGVWVLFALAHLLRGGRARKAGA